MSRQRRAQQNSKKCTSHFNLALSVSYSLRAKRFCFKCLPNCGTSFCVRPFVVFFLLPFCAFFASHKYVSLVASLRVVWCGAPDCQTQLCLLASATEFCVSFVFLPPIGGALHTALGWSLFHFYYFCSHSPRGRSCPGALGCAFAPPLNS